MGSEPVAPAPDRQYPVVLGDTFASGQAPDINALRFEFKPASVDASRPGLLSISATDKVTVDLRNQTADGPVISFSGNYEPARDVECILVFDPDRQVFVLDRMAGTVKNLRHDRHGQEQAAIRMSSIDNTRILAERPSTPTPAASATNASVVVDEVPVDTELDKLMDDSDEARDGRSRCRHTPFSLVARSSWTDPNLPLLCADSDDDDLDGSEDSFSD